MIIFNATPNESGVCDSLSIALDKIVAVYDKWSELNKNWVMTIHLVNGISYEITTDDEEMGCEVINAVERGSVKNTYFAGLAPNVLKIEELIR